MAAAAGPKGAEIRSPSRWTSLSGAVAGYLPGLVLAAMIAAAAYGMRLAPGFQSFSPMIIAIGLGVVMGNLVGVPDEARAGLGFATRRLLRLAIVLLGLQLTVAQLVAVGVGGLLAILATLVATFIVTIWLGRLLGVDAGLTRLIAAGTSICGASAVVAVNAATRAPDEDVAYAVACVTLFGTVAMLAYPLLPGVLRLDPLAYGLWSGASIHEVAQAVGASFAHGQAAGEFGTAAKLARVMMLAPVVIALGLIAARAAGSGAAGRTNVPAPWFVLGFLALVAVNSLFAIPAEAKTFIAALTTVLLTVALAALGIGADLSKLRARGVRPLILGLCSFLFIACFSLGLVKLVG